MILRLFVYNSNTVKTVEADSSDINSQIIGEWVWNSNDTHKLVVSCKKHDGTVINRFVDLDSNLFPNNGKIPDGTDFNSLLTVGKYFVVSDDKTLTMTNVPEKVSGRLFVLNMLGDEKVLNKEYQYFIQIYLLYTGTLWMRTLRRENDGSPIIFDNWVKRW